MAIPNFPAVDATNKRIPNPSTPISESFKTMTASIQFDAGFEQRRKKGATLSIFQLEYKVLTNSQYVTLRNFFLDCTDVVSFAWTHPISKTVYKCKFDANSFSGQSMSHNGKVQLWSCKFNIQQVL